MDPFQLVGMWWTYGLQLGVAHFESLPLARHDGQERVRRRLVTRLLSRGATADTLYRRRDQFGLWRRTSLALAKGTEEMNEDDGKIKKIKIAHSRLSKSGKQSRRANGAKEETLFLSSPFRKLVPVPCPSPFCTTIPVPLEHSPQSSSHNYPSPSRALAPVLLAQLSQSLSDTRPSPSCTSIPVCLVPFSLRFCSTLWSWTEATTDLALAPESWRQCVDAEQVGLQLHDQLLLLQDGVHCLAILLLHLTVAGWSTNKQTNKHTNKQT